ncbi:MAG: hypothetical protein RQ743_12820 [Bacteroidales bacterium]|nr:hypothetical protein [Bacteroidales bacterium]
MNQTLSSDLLFIVIALLIAALLGFLIGYFIRKPKVIIREIPAEPVEIETGDEVAPFSAEMAKAVMGINIKQDDLKIIKGIGPVIECLLKNNNIATWKSLATNSPGKLKSLMTTEGGPRFRVHDTGTWPEQARMAYEGKWEELKELQHEIIHGKVI